MEKIVYIILLIILESDFYNDIKTIIPNSYDFLVNKNYKLKEDYIPNDLEKINLELNNLNYEINLIENNNRNLENEINNLKNSLILKINLEKEKIKNKYSNKIEKNKINNLFNLENLNYEIENLQNIINNKKIKLNTLDLEQKNKEPKLNN